MEKKVKTSKKRLIKRFINGEIKYLTEAQNKKYNHKYSKPLIMFRG